jgi:hypothetical protein
MLVSFVVVFGVLGSFYVLSHMLRTCLMIAQFVIENEDEEPIPENVRTSMYT